MFAALDVKAQHFVLQILMLCIILDGKIKSKEMALFHVRSSPDTAHIMSDLGFALPVDSLRTCASLKVCRVNRVNRVNPARPNTPIPQQEAVERSEDAEPNHDRLKLLVYK